MGHSHDHEHGDRSQFYLEQLLTIGVCAAFGGVTVILWASGTLKNMLDAKFHPWVLGGGVALLLMSIINGVAVWQAAGKEKAAGGHNHDHDHDHDHDHAHDHSQPHVHSHDHTHCDHDHDHDHEHRHDHVHIHGNGHGHAHAHAHTHEKAHAETAVQTAAGMSAAAAAVVPQAAPGPAASVAAPAPASDDGHGHDGHTHGLAPWRFAVLLLPVAIYFIVPLGALRPTGPGVDVDTSSLRTGDNADSSGGSASATDSGASAIADKPTQTSFQQLEYAALYDENRAAYEGKTVQLVGQYVPKNSHSFTLRRYKISCCAADAVGLNAVILVDPNPRYRNEVLDGERLNGQWVQVTGRVRFLPRTDGNGVVTALILTPNAHWSLMPTSDHKDALVKVVSTPSNPYLN